MGKSLFDIVELGEFSEEERSELLKRSELDVDQVVPKVEKIVSDVREDGDLALRKYTEKFDGVEIPEDRLRVSEEEIKKAFDKVKEKDVDIIKKAADSVRRYHDHQLPEEWLKEFEPGIEAGQVLRSLHSAGAYVPGGTAKYPSSVLMSVIPAKVAGVENVILCTPPDSDGNVSPEVLVAADVSGADGVFKAGGAQAISAMAYGTGTVPRVDKIVGPGNIYVSAAKKIVSSEVEIDFLAGPSEVLVLADSAANPRFIALDLLAQAEHDPNSASVLVTTSSEVAEKVKSEVEELIGKIPREEIASESLRKNGLAVVADDLESAIDFVNDYAPEHLELMVENPKEVLPDIDNAGAIFLGSYSPTSAGDFSVGPSHILPTGGSARVFDGLSVYDFVRMPSVQNLSEEGLRDISDVLERLAILEGLDAHALSVKERLEVD